MARVIPGLSELATRITTRGGGQGNSTLEGQIRQKRTRLEYTRRRAGQIRELALMWSRSGYPIAASDSHQLRQLMQLERKLGRSLLGLRTLLYEITGSAYLPEEDGPRQLQFPLNPGGSDGEGRSEEGGEKGRWLIGA
jgi:hypothetical protein